MYLETYIIGNIRTIQRGMSLEMEIWKSHASIFVWFAPQCWCITEVFPLTSFISLSVHFLRVISSIIYDGFNLPDTQNSQMHLQAHLPLACRPTLSATP